MSRTGDELRASRAAARQRLLDRRLSAGTLRGTLANAGWAGRKPLPSSQTAAPFSSGAGGGCTPMGWLHNLVDVSTEGGDLSFFGEFLHDFSSSIPAGVDVLTMIVNASGTAQANGSSINVIQWSDPLPAPGTGGWESVVGYSPINTVMGNSLSATTTFSWPVEQLLLSDVGCRVQASHASTVDVSIALIWGCGDATPWIPSI